MVQLFSSLVNTKIPIELLHIEKEKPGAHKALCQRNRKVKVWRDNNKDNILDWEGETDTGYFGINIHRANEDSEG